MSIVKAFYHEGQIDLIEKPSQQQSGDVFVVFPDKETEIRELRGAIKPSKPIDYEQIATDLHNLSKQSENQITKEQDEAWDEHE